VHASTLRPRTKHYSARDNFTAVMAFEDGSVASLTYTALGTSQHAKEQLEVFVDGKVFSLNDYQTLTIKGASMAGVKTALPEKGQKAEIESFARAVLEGGTWPITLWEQLQAMEIAFSVEDSLGANS
jgi:predicted dehydrogenase